jgi:hypothetical protein
MYSRTHPTPVMNVIIALFLQLSPQLDDPLPSSSSLFSSAQLQLNPLGRL